MQVLWVHDHIFHVAPSNDIYSTGKLPYEIWKRYLSEFSTIHVLARGQPFSEQMDFSNLTLSSGPKVRFTFMTPLGNLRSFLFSRGAVSRKIREAVRASDAVIARLPSFNGELAVKAALAEGKPYAIEMVGCPWDSFWNYGNWQGRVMAFRAYLTTKKIVKKSSYVIYVSKYFLQKRYPCDGYTGSVSNVCIPLIDKCVLTGRLRKIKHVTSLGLIGDLNAKYKGIQVAIQALCIINRKFPKIRLKVLGTGAIKPWIEFAKKNNLLNLIEFNGTLPSGDAVFKWLDSIDIYIQPSFQEGVPRALVEAMSRACPSLGSTAGGIPELLASECLHAPGDYRNLSKDIIRLIQDKDWRVQQATRNFHRAADYSESLLNANRKKFWRNFAEFACQGQTQK